MSKVNIINYKAINEIVLKNNVYETYNIELPESYYCNSKIERKSLIFKVFVVKNEYNENNVIVNNKQVSFEKLTDEIIKLKNDNINESELPFLSCNLIVQKDISIGYVNKVRKAISNAGVFKILYAVNSKDKNELQKYNRDLHITIMTPYYFSDFNPMDEYNISFYKEQIIFVNYINKDSIKIQSEIVSETEFEYILKDEIKIILNNNPYYCIYFFINDNYSFQEYVNVVSKIYMTVYEIRNEYALDKYSKSYANLEWEYENEIREKFPILLFEVSDSLFIKELLLLE